MCVKRLGPSALAAVLLVGCIDGGRLTVDLPDTYLGEYDIKLPEVEDADAEGDGAGDVEADAPADAADVSDATDAAEAEVTPDTCQPGEPGCDACGVDADCAPLDDGDLCNGRWVCQGGQCVQDTTKVTCGAPPSPVGSCEVFACVPSTGECAVVARPNGVACNDGDPCTPGDHCAGGQCVSGPRIYCDDGDPCTTDSCKGGACQYTVKAGAACDDGNVCTTDDACNSAGQCRGLLSQCGCSVDADCAQFDDGNPCTGQVKCVTGECRVDLATIPLCAGKAESGCHVALCNPATGACESEPVADGAGCNDGDPCTVADACTGGVCAGVALPCDGGPCVDAACDPASGACVAAPNDLGGCECQADADCAALDDGDACNGTLVCLAGRCTVDVGSVVRCPASGPCVTVACDPGSGECVIDQASDGAACDDGDPCTTGDACADGECVGAAATCAAGDACNASVCHPFAGCRTHTLGGACDDGDACSQDGCLAGACATGMVKACPDVGQCQLGVCDTLTGACGTVANEGACDDGNACTVNDVCTGGTCVGELRFCDDGNPCTTDSCDPATGCVHTPNGHTCDDGNPCTTGDVCSQGVCAGSGSCECDAAIDCAAYDDDDLCNGNLTCQGGKCVVAAGTVVECDPTGNTPCAANTCQPATGACVMTPRGQGVACDDGDACTSGDACSGGACVGLPRACDDGNPCTFDSCDPASGCVHTPTTGGPCEDGNACTTDATCQDGVCGGGTNGCATCAVDADCAAHDDGNKCNGAVRCMGGQCVVDPATVVTCAPDGNFCTDRKCNPATGACETVAVNGGLACEDGNGCTIGDKCVGGGCIGLARDCDDGVACTKDSCSAATGACVHEPQNVTCSDGNACTTTDSCQGGVCVGANNTCVCVQDSDCDGYPLDRCQGEYACVAGGCVLVPGTAPSCGTEQDSPCSYQGCDPATGQCTVIDLSTGAECDDGDACTVTDRCGADKVCGGAARVCDDGNPCTVDTCDPIVGCVFTPVATGTACDDGDACTAGSTCSAAGVCGGGSNTCSCSKTSDCPALTTACGGTYTCTAGKCVKGAKVVCPDSGNPCRPNVCVPTTGQCIAVNAPNGSTCADGDLCTVDDACVAGKCTGKKASCDDGNPCTADSCAGGLCVHTPLSGGSCDDGDLCTVLTTCSAGICGGGLDKCNCSNDTQCATIDPDKCGDTWACVDNYCQQVPDSAPECVDEDPNDCVVTACSPSTGQCVSTPRPNGSACSDGTVCTGPDTCNAGVCTGTTLVACADPDPDDCLEVYCHPTLGGCLVRPRPDGATCSDDDACTTDERCVAGSCQGELVDCEDGNPCTETSCSAELGCVTKPLYGACDDGNPCTDGTLCDNGQCKGGVKTCGCTGDEDCADLAGGDLCAGVWTCVAQQCVHQAGTEVTCPTPPGAPCTEAVCDPSTGTCMNQPAAGTPACDDGSACTILDRCQAGACKGLKRNCDDGNPCTADSCDPAKGCVNAPTANGTTCDLAGCPDGGLCSGGSCQPSGAQACGCASDADCAAHEDGDFCNGTLRCGADGQCQVDPATVVACPADPTGCTVAACDPATGACLAEVLPDGSLCNDGDACTSGDACLSGGCAGVPVGCDDGVPCTRDSCDPVLGCIHEDFAGPCDDGNPCTTDDVCVDGTCSGVTIVCDDGEFCTVGSCTTAKGCVFNPKGAVVCDDGNPCTTGDKCSAGECKGNPVCGCEIDADCAASQPADKCEGQLVCVEGACVIDPATVPSCPASTACLDSVCDAATGACQVTPKNEGGACDDGDACTEDDTCVEGACLGDAVTCPDSDEPCKEIVCVPEVGCAMQDSTAPCNDGESCTVDDRCVGGQCVGQAPPTFASGFDDGDLADWTLSTTGEAAGWQASGITTNTGPLALYAGNPATGTLSDTAPWMAIATLPQVFVPLGVTIAELRFAMALDVEDPTCAAEVFTVAVNGATVYTACAPSGGFTLVTVDLTAFAGSVVEVQLVMDTVSTSTSGAMGAVVDDLVLDWACPVAGGL